MVLKSVVDLGCLDSQTSCFKSCFLEFLCNVKLSADLLVPSCVVNANIACIHALGASDHL